MSEWKRELHKDVVSWGYRRCEWSLGLFNTENLFRILCIHFERSFSRITLDVLFTLGYLALAVCLDGETYGSRPGTYIEFSRIQFFIFQYIQNAWFACGVIAGRFS